MTDAFDFNFELSEAKAQETVEHKTITLWVPAEVKAKFDAIQKKSKREFGKHLKKLVMHSIEKIKVPDVG